MTLILTAGQLAMGAVLGIFAGIAFIVAAVTALAFAAGLVIEAWERRPRRLPPVEPPEEEGVTGVG